MKKILVFTHCYPRDERDSAGVFVKDWVEMVREGGYPVELFLCGGMSGELRSWWMVVKAAGMFPRYVWSGIRAARKADLLAAHWLFPSGVLAILAGGIRRKPVYLVLHGDPFLIERNRLVRFVARLVLRFADCVQVVSTPCLKIVKKIYSGRTVMAPMPTKVIP